MKQKKSFTLIEMLIVIVIIGILAAALVPRLQSVQSRARDAKRKADLNQLNTAMQIKYGDRNSLPASVGRITTGTHAYLELTGYMTSVPLDPQTPTTNYGYRRKDWDIVTYYGCATNLTNANKYAFYVKLENAPTGSDTGTMIDIFDACMAYYWAVSYRTGN